MNPPGHSRLHQDKGPSLLFREDGVAIVAVLWICTLIMWFGLQIGADTRLLGEEQVHMLRRSQALYLAIGGCYEAMARMGTQLPLNRDEPPDTNWQPDGQPRLVNYETGRALVIVQPEEEKLNVNKADPRQLGDVLVKAGASEDAAESLADLIADFIDTDDTPRLKGGEKDYYQKLGLGYVPFDGPLTALDQLLLVPGITDQLLYGFGTVQNPDDEGGPEITIPLLPSRDSLFSLLSVHGKGTGVTGTSAETDSTDRIVTWRNNGIYRIYSCGKSNAGAPSVVICLIVRYSPGSQSVCEILYRKVF